MPRKEPKRTYTAVQEQQEERKIPVRYTGRGKCYIVQHMFDPGSPDTLVLHVDRETYETKLKPMGCFEVVV